MIAKPAKATAPAPAAFPRSTSRFPLLSAAFLVFCFLYVWLRIEPALEYQRFSPVFFCRYSFFAEFLARPGGLADYAAAFLAQLNIYSWLGALAFTVLCGTVSFLTRGVLRKSSGSTLDFVPLMIPFLLLILRDRYSPHTLLLATGLTAALGSSLGVTRLPATAVWLRLIFCWVTALLLFYLAGFWPLASFAVLCCLDEAVRGVSLIRPLLSLLCVVPPLLWLLWPTDLDRAQIFNPWGKGLPFGAAIAAYAFAPAVAAALALYRNLIQSRARGDHPPRQRTHPDRKNLPARTSFPWLGSPWIRVGLFVAACAAVWIGLDSRVKKLARIEYYTATGDYARVPPLAAQLSRNEMDPSTEIRLQFALYHTGRLCEDLFYFRNQTGWNPLPGLSFGVEACRPQSHVLLELGLVSDAEHYAHEALELEGDRPEILRLLARINLVKPRPNAARVFLTALSQVPFQGAWARAWLRASLTNASPPDDSQLNWIRSCMFTNDLPHDSLAAEQLLRQLLYRNNGNRMAFEYLMAYYLVNLRLDKIVEALPALDFFGYKQMPRHLEEAVLIYQKMNKTQLDLHGRAIRPETIQRFERMSAALQQGLDKTLEGRNRLTRDFGDTFWYFYLARRNQ